MLAVYAVALQSFVQSSDPLIKKPHELYCSCHSMLQYSMSQMNSAQQLGILIQTVDKKLMNAKVEVEDPFENGSTQKPEHI